MLLTVRDVERAAVSTRTVDTPLENLSGTALRLYHALQETGQRVGEARGYVKAVSQVHFFVPGEIVADACNMARSTMYLKLKELVAAELVEGRAHYVTHQGHTRADGMVWAVKLDAAQPGRVRVPYDALKQSYRCLSADIENGRTAWKEIGQSRENPSREVKLEKILAWALPPSITEEPVTGLTVRSDLEAVLDVPYVAKDDRRVAVDGAARALSTTLGDAGSVMFYRWLLWQLLRLADKHQGDHWHTVYEMARRASTDAQEGFARKPGALFVSRLKQWAVWEELRRLPPYAVGTPPRDNQA
jgi:hypothetical protein